MRVLGIEQREVQLAGRLAWLRVVGFMAHWLYVFATESLRVTF